MVLFSRVDDILATLATANLALTPHQTKPEKTLEAIVDNEVASLKHGIFNLGFIGVSNTEEGRRFADWWAQRTQYLCRAEVANGLFTDQKWLNFAPVFFEGVAILKSPRHNVATWNLTTRRMSGDFDAGFEVDGEPLAFYHFTGFDSGAHRIMAAKNASASPSVQKLIAWYASEIEVAEHDPVSQWPWAFGRFSDGTPIERAHRWLYRESPDLHEAFPDPYDAAPGRPSFLSWCETEGRLRFPQIFPWKPDFDPAHLPPLHARVSVGGMMRLPLLMMSPRAGKSLRGRLYRMFRARRPARHRPPASGKAPVEYGRDRCHRSGPQGPRRDPALPRQRAGGRSTTPLRDGRHRRQNTRTGNNPHARRTRRREPDYAVAQRENLGFVQA